MKIASKRYQGRYHSVERAGASKRLYGGRLVGCRQDLKRVIVEKILAEIAWNG